MSNESPSLWGPVGSHGKCKPVGLGRALFSLLVTRYSALATSRQMRRAGEDYIEPGAGLEGNIGGLASGGSTGSRSGNASDDQALKPSSQRADSAAHGGARPLWFFA